MPAAFWLDMSSKLCVRCSRDGNGKAPAAKNSNPSELGGAVEFPQCQRVYFWRGCSQSAGTATINSPLASRVFTSNVVLPRAMIWAMIIKEKPPTLLRPRTVATTEEPIAGTLAGIPVVCRPYHPAHIDPFITLRSATAGYYIHTLGIQYIQVASSLTLLVRPLSFECAFFFFKL